MTDALTWGGEKLSTLGGSSLPPITKFGSAGGSKRRTVVSTERSPYIQPLEGRQSGLLTIEQYLGVNGYGDSLWQARCSCGATRIVVRPDFMRGDVKSCGVGQCNLKARPKPWLSTHGMTSHPVYAVWRSMIDRCRLPTHQAWHNYGARGISVCEEWQTFEGFWQFASAGWAPGLSIERKDNDGNYTPENCHWIPRYHQAKNRRKTLWVDTPKGRMVALDAAKEFGVKATTLYWRIHNGWPPERLFESTT